MKRIYKVHIITLILIVALICSAAISFVACNKEREAWEIYEEKWNFEFPDDVKTEFHVAAIGWPSDGVRYSIFTFENRPDKLLEDFKPDKANQSRDAFEECLDLLYTFAQSKKIEYDKDKVVLPNENCIWKIQDNSSIGHIYMAYDEDDYKLYITELII